VHVAGPVLGPGGRHELHRPLDPGGAQADHPAEAGFERDSLNHPTSRCPQQRWWASRLSATKRATPETEGKDEVEGPDRGHDLGPDPLTGDTADSDGDQRDGDVGQRTPEKRASEAPAPLLIGPTGSPTETGPVGDRAKATDLSPLGKAYSDDGVSDFFEPPPPPPRREPRERMLPPWLGPPNGTVPGVVALEIPLVRTERFAIFITRLDAYPEGFGFDVFALAAPGQDEEGLPDPMLFGPGPHRLRHGRGEIPDDVLRIGVQFSDGRKATNTAGFPRGSADFENPPEGPVLHSGGGGGGGGSWHQSEWVWPLPPPGPLAFVCQWPAASIPLTRHEIDAQVILDAAARAQVVFPAGLQHDGGTFGGRWIS
jgi:hypothetical protein